MNQLFDDLGAVAKMIGGGANIGADGFVDKGFVIVAQVGFKETCHRWTDVIDNRLQVWRLVFGGALEFFQSSIDGATLRVPEHDDQARVEAFGGKFDTSDQRWRNNVTGDTNYEQVAESLIENDLDRHARIGTAENCCKGLLPGREGFAAVGVNARIGNRRISDESLISLLEPRESFASRDHGSAVFDVVTIMG